MVQHTYEELRDTVVDILLKRAVVAYEPSQWRELQAAVAEVFSKKENPAGAARGYPPPRLHPNDAELVRDVFWDLFRQGFITLGLNDSNEQWPWFRLSHLGERALKTQSPYRFHDTNSFLALVQREVPDISSEASIYLAEAVTAFYAGCSLASCVMLGVAAEAEFLRLAEVTINSQDHGQRFSGLQKRYLIRQKSRIFRIVWSL
ncbi:MAG TPA: hypothetical protein VIY49_35900 [Bryobacteraceae bacterium]